MNIFKDKGPGFCGNIFSSFESKKKKNVAPSCLVDFSNWHNSEQALLRALRF